MRLNRYNKKLLDKIKEQEKLIASLEEEKKALFLTVRKFLTEQAEEEMSKARSKKMEVMVRQYEASDYRLGFTISLPPHTFLQGGSEPLEKRVNQQIDNHMADATRMMKERAKADWLDNLTYEWK